MEAPSRTVQKEGTLCILVRRLLHSLMHIERNKMFEEKIERKDLAKMPAEYIDLLGRVLTIQADCEIGGPHLYVKDILLTAPTKVNQLIVARTAAEEMDHYRKIARWRYGNRRVRITQRAQPRALFGGLSRNHYYLGRFLGVRLFDRSSGSISTRGVSRLQLSTVTANTRGDPQGRDRSYRLRHQSNCRVGCQERGNSRAGSEEPQFLVYQSARYVWPDRL